MEGRWRCLIFVVCMFLGGCLFAYPFFCNWVYEKESCIRIQEYEDSANEKSMCEIEEILAQARAYNQSLVQAQSVLTDPFLNDEGISSGIDGTILDVEGTGQIGYLEIPCIDVELPVYEGTGEDVLKKGAGRLEGSSLPVGGASTRTVIAGHTGLDVARLFTDLVDMREGDVFYLHVLDRTLAYQVSLIETVLPEETGMLAIQEGKDLCTLVTCTPYGVNTHRLLVTGERLNGVSYPQSEETVMEGNHVFGNNGIVKNLLCLAGIGFLALCVCRQIEKRKRRGLNEI